MKPSRPNIVFVMADDMGYGDFGIFNDQISCTPNLDQLTETGICLTQHYSASCVCTPARAGLLTGRYPHRTGAIEMRSIRGLDRLSLKEITMADYFKKAGYKTGLVGKWHTGAYGDEYHPNRRGFDEFFGFRGGGMHYFDWTLQANGRNVKKDGRYLTDYFTEEAVNFIGRHKADPFFLCVHYNAPHSPLEALESDLAKFEDPSKNGRGPALIYSMIYRMDAGLEMIRQKLKDEGLEENTIFLFTSDNGPAMYETEGMSQERFNCNFAGGKGSVYEGGIKVPMILYWPQGGLSGGKRFDDFAHFTDWLPSLVSVCDQVPLKDRKYDGCNIMPALQNDNGKVNPRRFWQWNRFSPVLESNAAMRDGPWKLVRPIMPETMKTSKDEFQMDRELEDHPERFVDILRTPEPARDLPAPPPVELYNIEKDPEEKHNLADKHPAKAQNMLQELEDWFREVEEERSRIPH